MLASLWTALALVCLCHGLDEFAPSLDQCTSHFVDNHKLNATRLKLNDVTTLRVDAESAKDCVGKCCSSNITAKNACSIAEFYSGQATQNCMLVYCQWLDEECQWNVVAGGDENVTLSSIIRTVVAPSAAIDLLLSDSTTKIERTIKPRKGVSKMTEHGTAATRPVTVTAILPTQPATEPEGSDVTTDQVLPTDATSTAATEVVADDDDLNSTTSGTPSYVSPGSDVTPLPDLDADKHKHTVPRKGVLGAFSHFPAEEISDSKEAAVSNQAESRINLKNASHLEREQPEITSLLKSTGPPASAAVHSDNKTGSTSVHQEVPTDNETLVPTVPPNGTSERKQAGSSVHVLVPVTKVQSEPPSNVTVSSVAPPTTNDIYLNSQQTDELTIEQSVYLIASLIIGFLVLLTVIGLVMRHVHGVWERRHYQRMDFLIDGMYNNM